VYKSLLQKKKYKGGENDFTALCLYIMLAQNVQDHPKQKLGKPGIFDV
jgi:hypothetical protein